jgi:outer membrane protein assembly factor BamB
MPWPLFQVLRWGRKADWPVWRGPNRDGISTETLAGTEVTKLWTAQVGIGFASFTVADGSRFHLGA